VFAVPGYGTADELSIGQYMHAYRPKWSSTEAVIDKNLEGTVPMSEGCLIEEKKMKKKKFKLPLALECKVQEQLHIHTPLIVPNHEPECRPLE
jgi:hypothetical protein